MKKLLVIFVFTFISACSVTNSPDRTNESSVPEWYTNPHAENGVAAAECVKFNGNLSISKTKAQALAIAALASQIETSVENTVESTINTSNDVEMEKFKSETVTYVRQSVSGARIEKVEAIKLAEGDQLCVLVVIETAYFENAVKKGVLDPMSQKSLISGFNLEQARQKL
ncbi:hypothetical protein EKG38_10740 [Shewanella canadensis]|uniref:LPP20 family lipoprotein n=1 Tax=Shewanella canadensis TaxID=271096 RepID=A0A431WU09_9GAMM|nr:LPP20 family lipoprotein [Shewanella canadensis]RTR38649.1 hypothetical protein EKG38_10740 [Shewanella canadensis]